MQWTAEADRKLLLLLLDVSNVKYADVANKWTEVYGTTHEGEPAPTARALENRLSKLKKMVNGGIPSAKGSASSKIKTPTTPRIKKSQTPKSTNGKKRKKSVMSDGDEEESFPSDETDPEAEQQQSLEAITPRGSLPRGKKVRKTYKDGTSTSEDDERDVTYGISPPIATLDAVDSPMEGQESFGIAEKEIKVEENPFEGVDMVLEVADFQP